jgi:hypothetical protein
VERDSHEGAEDIYAVALSIADEPEPNLTKVHSLLRSAHSKGDKRAKYAIATWLLHGVEGIVHQDVRTGIQMLRELQYDNIPEALFDLAVSYDLGKGVKKNEKKAFSLYMRSALLGSSDASFQISEFYREGRLVSRDVPLARAWKVRSERNEQEISPPYRLWLRAPPDNGSG